MTKNERLVLARTRAYNAAKKYMKQFGRPHKVAEMNEKDLKLFSFVRDVNENIFMTNAK